MLAWVDAVSAKVVGIQLDRHRTCAHTPHAHRCAQMKKQCSIPPTTGSAFRQHPQGTVAPMATHRVMTLVCRHEVGTDILAESC